MNDNNLSLNYVVIAGFESSGIQNYGGRVLVQNTLIYLNTAGFFGGGVQNTAAQNSNGSVALPSFVAKYSSISFNSAAQDGGAIYNEGKLDLRSTVVQQNVAPFGAAIYNYSYGSHGTPGASCNVERDVSTAQPSDVDSNDASASGGYGYSIVDGDSGTGILCSFHDTVGTANSSPYCTPGTVSCPQ